MALRIRTIIEVIGKPPEHIKKIIDSIVNMIKKEKNIKVIKQDIAPPEKIKDETWSTFAELELELPDLLTLNHFCFFYLPSSVEILDTTEIKIKTQELTNSINDMLARLHQYNTTVFAITQENKQLKNKITKLTKPASS